MKKSLLMSLMAAAVLAAGCGEKKESDPSSQNRGPSLEEPAPLPGSRAAPAPAPGPETVESLADEFGMQLEQMARAMQGVKDAASAEKAAEIISLVSGEFRSIVERLQKLEIPGEDVKRRINEKMEERQEAMARSLGDQEAFMDNLPGEARPIVEKAMEGFMATMNELHPVMADYFEVEEESEEPPPPATPPAVPE